MSNLEYLMIKGGIFMPAGLTAKHDVVYDANFRIIEESCVLRGQDKSENISEPLEGIPEDIRSKIKYVDKRFLFMGQFDRSHYGHLLTEGIARHWYLLDNEDGDFKIPTSRKSFSAINKMKRRIRLQNHHWQEALQAFAIKMSDISFFDQPIQVKEVIVPECSMYIRNSIHRLHRAVTNRIARYIAGSSMIAHDLSPVYLSRTKLTKRKVIYEGEQAIEDFCKKNGCKIVYPERLSLKQQIILFNVHDVFIGPIGSAFHSTLFRFEDRRATNIYLSNGNPNSNYELIDELMGNNTHSIEAASGSGKKQVLHIEKAIASLAKVL